MDDVTQLKHLTKGLNAAGQIHMDLKSPETTEEFLEALIKYGKWQEEGNIQQRMQYSLIQQEQYSVIPQQRHNYSSQQQQPLYPTRGSSQARQNNSEKNYGGCWSCGDIDHYHISMRVVSHIQEIGDAGDATGDAGYASV